MNIAREHKGHTIIPLSSRCCRPIASAKRSYCVAVREKNKGLENRKGKRIDLGVKRAGASFQAEQDLRRKRYKQSTLGKKISLFPTSKYRLKKMRTRVYSI